MVGCRTFHRQSRLEQASGFRAGQAVRRGAAISRRPGRRAVPHGRRLEDQLAVARSAARSLGLSESAKILRDDHSESIWRAGLLGLRAFGSGPQVFVVLDLPACTAMVPNSLGPGELLVQFGTKAQQDYWLPRLARGEEIPCFGLTSPEAGSDAASMIDSGVVCRGTYEGREVLGIRLNWHKRYITLGPIATVLGLAFKLHDPDHLIGDRDDIGITLALVPTHLPGISIGRRHLPAHARLSERPELGPRRIHSDGRCHRRRRTSRQGLENADERTRSRARHFVALAVRRGRRVFRPRDRRLCAHPRAIPRLDRKIRSDSGAARPHGGDRLSARRGAAHDLRGARRRTPSRRRHRHHEGAGDRTHACLRQRCYGRARRQRPSSKGR